MDAVINYDRATIIAAMEENQKNVRNLVLESYQDMLEGKGRDYKVFFEEVESRYKNARV